MPTNRMDLVCTVCGEALELASYEESPFDSERHYWELANEELAGEHIADFLSDHAHSASPLFGPTCFRLAFDAEQESG